MIRYTQGDLLKADAEALVNTVNCVGFMGRGIAAQFRRAFPQNFQAYKAACDRGEIQPGRVLAVELGHLVGPRYILNFPTKRHWRANSRLEDITAGLCSLRYEILTRGIQSVAVPPLGCGLGGLRWEDVRPLIEDLLQDLDGVDVVVYEPTGAPAAEVMVRSQVLPTMTSGRAVLVALMDRYLSMFMDPFVSLLEVHKLMYFVQEAGEPLRLKYRKARYGPYAENLRHVLAHIEGHFIEGYADGGDDPTKPLVLRPGAARAAEMFLATVTDTRQRFDRVVELVNGFESAFGMELLATVHWVAIHEQAMDLDAVTAGVHEWNEGKHQFKPRHIEIAWDTLRDHGWLD